MHEMHQDEDVAFDAQARAHWVHALRNAANTAGVTLAMTRRLLQQGDAVGAMDMLARCDEAWGEARCLLRDAGRATCLPAGLLSAPEGERAPASPFPHR